MQPGSTTASRLSASIDKIRWMYFEKSMMIEMLQLWPARARAAAARRDRNVVRVAQPHGRDHILCRLGKNDADTEPAGSSRRRWHRARGRRSRSAPRPRWRLPERPELVDLVRRNFDAAVPARVRWIRAGLELGGCAPTGRSCQASYLRASAARSVRPCPGCERSGATVPFLSCGAPSNSMLSMRT